MQSMRAAKTHLLSSNQAASSSVLTLSQRSNVRQALRGIQAKLTLSQPDDVYERA